MKTRTSRKAEAVIPTASMADIAFLLIIFFMVTTTHELDKTSVNLPVARSREQVPPGSPIVVLGTTDDGQYVYKFSDGENMSHAVPGPEEIFLEASRVTAMNSNANFVVKADGEVRFEKIDEILDNLRKADVERLVLLSHQATEGGGGSE